MLSKKELLEKYNVPVPRYTSYPTVPFWDEDGFRASGWEERLQAIGRVGKRGVNLALYIHLPFCESLCTFCGCNKRITKNHGVEQPYLEALRQEWTLYQALLPEVVVLEEVHLGGGTPTFFAAEGLRAFLEDIFSTVKLHPQAQMSLEGHPNHTDTSHLKALASLGFKRISFGVQDYDPVVQKAIHRMQSYEQVAKVTAQARGAGFEFISHDLVFGLPFQTPDAVKDSIEKTIALKPDRISFYSYAHVPWVKGTGQRGFSEEHLPLGEQKRTLYELGKAMLEEAGYHEIGFDHFALETDELFKARQEGSLHRNFMGYTTTRSEHLIGLGVSAIGDIGTAYAQNEKTLEGYYAALHQGRLPVFRGHLMSERDTLLKKLILDLMCRFSATIPPTVLSHEVISRLAALSDDGLVRMQDDILQVTEAGVPFIRNICLALDERFWAKQPEKVLFSVGV